MSGEAPANDWDTSKLKPAKTTGVYGAAKVPGTYLKTITGVQRGEELFHRPELERPWRTTSAQQHAAILALKEKEIEELTRKCSSLRTQLGNAKHDVKYLEYAVTEKSRAHVMEVENEMEKIKAALKMSEEEKRELKETTEHQLRLMKSQHENELLQLKTECRMYKDRYLELTKIYQQQVDDVKKASTQALEHVESLCSSRVGELSSELKAAHDTKIATEGRHVEELTETKNLLHRIEADYKERIRAAEQRVDEVRTRLETENTKILKERDAALKEARLATEQLAVTLTDGEEVTDRFKKWNTYILRLLDRFYTDFIEISPDLAKEPHDPDLCEAPTLYAPRKLLEDPDTKLAVERIVYRLMQLKHLDHTQTNKMTSEKNERNLVDEVANACAKQERLSLALKEIDSQCQETALSLGRTLSRLHFFSDDLENAIMSSGSVPPPQKNVVFVCLSVFKGIHLWTDDEETASASVALMNSTIRMKMAQYAAYECYSDGTSMLLAFEDAVSACRFCVESQIWLLNIPWPESLLRSKYGKVIYGNGNTVLFRGLRVSMAVHAGEVFAEVSAIPCGDSYRCHYYGRAVSQVIHICSLARGGQVLVTSPVWDVCRSKRYGVRSLAVHRLGDVPIVSYSKETNSYEKVSLLLHQILPDKLEDRSFEALDQSEETSVSSLAKMMRSLVSTEIDCLEVRRSSIREAIKAANEEFVAVDRHINALADKTRTVKSYFHLLPPPDMVAQMNDLYSIMEKIASRASDLQGNIRIMENLHEDMTTQIKGLKAYSAQRETMSARDEELQIRAELMKSHYEEQLTALRQNRMEEIERFRAEIRERDQLIQILYRESRVSP